MNEGRRGRDGFDSGLKLCSLTMFFLGNYFSVFGMRHAAEARKLHFAGDEQAALRRVSKAKWWAWWGLLFSTPINAAIIYAAYLLLYAFWRYMKQRYVY